MIHEKIFIHHYAPKDRFREPGTIIIRQAGDPFVGCYDKAEEIYDKVRRLLATVETWLANSLDEDIKKQTVQNLHNSMSKTIDVAFADVENLITVHQVTDDDDVKTIRDVVVQLQEIADDIFEPYLQQ